jgi:DNA polymerase III delta prime subunit
MTPQEEVKRILFESDRNQTWLANKLGLSRADLNYQLNTAKNYSADLHNRIMTIFKKEGYNSKDERCQDLLDQTLLINSMIGNSIQILNNNVQKFTKDNVLDFRERKRLLDVIEKMKSDYMNELERIEKIVEG